MTDAPDDAPEPATARGVDQLSGVWDDVRADMEATAEEFREDGWDVLELQPGDIATPAGERTDRWGIDILAADNEFEELEQLVANHEFSQVEVFRGESGNLVLLVVAMLAPDTEHAIVFPAYYDLGQARGMLDRARSEGEMRTHVRPLDEHSIVSFRHEDLGLFLPTEE